MKNSQLLVVTPTYNEAENIEYFMQNVKSLGLDLLIVDDNSPDGTSNLVRKFADKSNGLFLITRGGKLGLGSAYREGFNWALNKNYNSIIEMDADFSHTFEDLQNLIKQTKNTDLVIGSRYIDGGSTLGWDFKRKLLSKTANVVTKYLVGSSVNDLTSGFRIYSHVALKKIDFNNIKSDGYSFQIEMTCEAMKNNLRIKEYPITFSERRLGKSKMDIWIILEALRTIFSLFFKRYID